MSKSAEIICVGTELLLGDIVDTNSQHLSRGLAEIGINLFHRETVGDNHDRLVCVLKRAISENDIVITSGGLGATCDDITKEGVAEAMGLKLVLHEPSLERIKEHYRRRDAVMTENNVKQAYLPEGAIVFDNDYGTAPITAVQKDGKTVIMLPGVPRELVPMFDEKIKPWLKEQYSDAIIVSRNLRLYGIGEAAAEDLLRDLMDSYQNPTIAPYAKTGEVLLRLTAKGQSEKECNALIDSLFEKVEERVGQYIYGIDVGSLEEAMSRVCREKGLTVSFAESCTGGMCAKRVIDLPGASKVIGMSVVTYHGSAKQKLLGVKSETIEKYGLISHECAKEMAVGLLSLSEADIAVSVTGVAGPDTDEGKAIGTVYIGVASKRGVRSSFINLARGKREREYIRTLAANAAINEARLEALLLNQ
ncbi:MAG: competence/damage-inducible protein A [Ruminococcaceae bacterium]|nr:competence/damage-inducible protein A [Oscillospiraceae bacterium]